MWQRFKNIFFSVSRYADLSPDLRTRRQVQRWLRDRPALPLDEWVAIWESQGISRPMAEFVVQQMREHSGLDFARVQPSDRLIEDLKLPLICWFDWEITLGNQFFDQFGVDISEWLAFEPLHTVADLVHLLQQRLDDKGCGENRSGETA
jgi:hypothetical protein